MTLHPVQCTLAHRRPLAAGALFGYLAATAVPGLEEWREGAYRRTLRLPRGPGIVELRPGTDGITLTGWLSRPEDLAPAAQRCRRLLDLDANPAVIDAHLAAEPSLRPLVTATPGVRVLGTVDGSELALRIVLGQQISTAAARSATAKLVQQAGEPIEDPDGALTHLFPQAQEVAGMDPLRLAGPRRRAQALVGLARALADEEIDVDPGADLNRSRRDLLALPGIGPWTVEMMAMRGLGDPDAWPASDLGLRRAWEAIGQPDPSAWRPWRSYAVHSLWASLDHPINRMHRTAGD